LNAINYLCCLKAALAGTSGSGFYFLVHHEGEPVCKIDLLIEEAFVFKRVIKDF